MPAMWFPKHPQCDWKPAQAHLRRVSPVFREVIDRVGPCTLAPRKDYFQVLCKAIFSQQISTQVAAVLFQRFCALFPRQRPTPAKVLELLAADGDVLKGCGLSRQKRAYIADLALHFNDNRIPTRRLASMSDDDVIDALVQVKGIGRWTAEMFLMFTLNRPDVFPVDDLGLRKGAEKLFNGGRPMDLKKLTKLAEPWRPYRTVATWYIWRGLSNATPASKQRRRADRKKS